MSEQAQSASNGQASPERTGEVEAVAWSVLDALDDPICVVDGIGRIIAINRAWRDNAAAKPPLTAMADVGASYFAIWAAAAGQGDFQARKALRGLQAVAQSELTEFVLEYPGDSPPDTQQGFEMRVARVAGGSGAALVVTHRDITQRRRSDDLLRTQCDLLMALGQAPGLPEMLRICLEAALRISGMECGGIYLADASGGWRLAASSGLSDCGSTSAPDHPANSHHARLMKSGQAVYQAHAEWMSRPTGAEPRETLRALAMIPIQHEQKLIGCLNLASRRRDDVPPQSRVALETLASTAALLISRAQTEEQLRAIADFTYDWESWISTDGRPMWINPAVERITGVPAADCLRMADYPLPLIHPDDRERMRSHFVRALTGASGNDVPFRVNRRDGSGVWCAISWQPITATDGTALGYRSSVRDINVRKRTEEAMRLLNAELEDRVVTRTAELADALARLAIVEERERHRISRELHDQTAQRLVAVAIELKTMESNHAAGRPLGERLQSLRRMVDALQQQVRQIAWNLRAGEQVEGRLDRALREYAEDWSERARVPVDCECRGLHGVRLPALIEATLYRVAQEALANVEKHARARRVSVLLECDKSLARLIVEDDGCGFDAETIPQSPDASQRLGLLGMKERVALAGGTLLIESSPRAGTTILVRLPMPTDAKRT